MKASKWVITVSTMLLALWHIAAMGQPSPVDTAYSSQFRENFHNLQYHDSIGDQGAVIEDMMSISWLFTNTGELDKSMEFLQRAQNRCLQAGDSARLANVLLLLADNYKSIGAYNTAFGYYRQSDSLFCHAGNTPFHVFTHYCMAYCKQNEYEHTKAIADLDTALAMVREQKPMTDSLLPKHKSTMRLIVIRILISKAYSAESDSTARYLTDALELCRKAINESQEANENMDAYFQINEADALLGLGQMREAGKLLSRINERDISNQHLDILYPIKYRYYKLSGDYKKALEYFEKSQKLSYKTFNTENANQSHRYQALIQYNKIMEEYERKRNLRDTEFRIKNEHLQTRNNILKVNALIVMAIVVLMILDSLILKRINNKLQDAKSEIEEQNAQLQQIHDTIEEQTAKIRKQCHTLGEQAKIASIFRKRQYDAIRLAKSIQDALMASPESLREYLKDFFIYWKPVAQVSGDFYWLRKAGPYTYLIVADATGHGVPGAFLSMLGISIMNDISSEINLAATGTQTGHILDTLKERFTNLMLGGNNQINDSIDLVMIRIDSIRHRIQYSGANRPLILVSDGEVTEFKPTRMCIGYNVLDRGKFATNIVDYEPGDMIYLFSDGLSDQFGGLDSHTKFGTRRLYELFSGIYDLPSHIQESTIAAVFHQWTNMEDWNVKVNQIDDQIVAGIRL